LVHGLQKVAKFNQVEEDLVQIAFALYRFTDNQADVLFTHVSSFETANADVVITPLAAIDTRHTQSGHTGPNSAVVVTFGLAVSRRASVAARVSLIEGYFPVAPKPTCLSACPSDTSFALPGLRQVVAEETLPDVVKICLVITIKACESFASD
uniref:Amidase domain-containing protein n=1 Tax=Schistocephalus solidus TaxID=70667 RepID=A0A183T6N9_SCHSO